MKNVTITLDEDTAQWIRVQAANRATSVSRVVGEMLRERRHAAQTLVVGHNPHLSELLCLLTGAHAGAFEMKKAGLACLETFQTGPTPRAMLAWLMTPKSVGA